MKEAPYYWVKKIENSLQEAQVIPLWGHFPSFPWKKCAKRLEKDLALPPLSLEYQDTQWRNFSELTKGMGRAPLHITFELSPLEGVMHWIFASEDLSKLVAASLSTDPLLKGFTNKELQEGYFSLLAVQTMQVIEKIQAYPHLSFKLAPQTALPQEGALCVDVKIELDGTLLWGRVVAPALCLKAFRQHFEKPTPPFFTHELRQQIEVPLHLQVGLTHLPLADLQQIALGDLLILDQCTVNPHTQEGSVTLMLYNTPLLEGSLSQKNIQIINYIHSYEEQTMAKDYYDDEEDDFDEDEDLDDEDLDEEYADEEDLDDEDEDLDDDFEEEDIDEEELDTASIDEEESPEHLWSSDSEESTVGKIITTTNLPVTVTVEMAKIRMNLNKLLELQPGNVIDLHTSVTQPLDIRMNGKKIARGELIQIGDVLGVKILHIGSL